MDKNELLKSVGELGFPLMETSEYDFNQVLAEVVKSNNLRLWEGFPVMLKNALDEDHLNVDVVKALLSFEERSQFWHLVCMSTALYRDFHLSFTLDVLTHSDELKEETKKWHQKFALGGEMVVGEVVFSLDKVKRLFQDYYLSVQAEVEKKKRVAKEEVSLEYALSQVLSLKQKELFRKKLDGKKMTKTEREYYSRVVKKKVYALANEELHRLACLLRE